MAYWYRLHEVPKIRRGCLPSLFRGADLCCFYPVFCQADEAMAAGKIMDKHINDLVVYNALIRGPFPDMPTAVAAAKEEFLTAITTKKIEVVLT